MLVPGLFLRQDERTFNYLFISSSKIIWMFGNKFLKSYFSIFSSDISGTFCSSIVQLSISSGLILTQLEVVVLLSSKHLNLGSQSKVKIALIVLNHLIVTRKSVKTKARETNVIFRMIKTLSVFNLTKYFNFLKPMYCKFHNIVHI